MQADDPSRLSALARRAVQERDWLTVDRCAQQILLRDGASAEGLFLTGLVHKAANRPLKAAAAFEAALARQPDRYDAAIELANQYSIARRNGEALGLLERYCPALSASPRYSDLAGTVYVDIGLPEKAWPMYRQASRLQPGVDRFEANLAACAVYMGEIDEAERLYRGLLQRSPAHQRNHYHLSRLRTATNRVHLDQMLHLLERLRLPPGQLVFLYFAIAKELEDLGEWREAFRFYRLGGDDVCSVARYDVADDVGRIDEIISLCTADWLVDSNRVTEPAVDRRPVFIVGLPRTGTTLAERILSSHSQIQSVGETLFLQMAIRRESGVAARGMSDVDILRAAAARPMHGVARGYIDAIRYRLDARHVVVDKLPFNFDYCGFIAKAFPDATIVHLRRNPMDACFSMFKQVFTFPYKFSYNLNDLGDYYIAYERLRNHWKRALGGRWLELEYEDLVRDQLAQTRRLLDALHLPFEDACLAFDRNAAASTTASAIQVREGVHDRSIGKWRRFAAELDPLRRKLAEAGIDVESGR
jgi:tetratricopeptide (TPR) repeat protein